MKPKVIQQYSLLASLLFIATFGLSIILSFCFKNLISRELSIPVLNIIFFGIYLILFTNTKLTILKLGKVSNLDILVIIFLLILFVVNNLFGNYKEAYIAEIKNLLYFYLLSLTLGSISEEIIYRGFLQTYINERNNNKNEYKYITTGNLFSSSLMTITHLGFFLIMKPSMAVSSIILVFVASLTFGYLRDKTKGIIIPILVHILCNYVHILIIFFKQNIPI